MRRRCLGPHRSLLLVTALAEIISEARGALKVGVEVLTDPTMLVQLPNVNDGLPADVGVLHYHGIRGSQISLDAVVSGLFGVSSPPSLEVARRRAEKTKFEKYSDGGEESSRHPLHSVSGHGIWHSRGPRHGLLNGASQEGNRL
jgi:hypothetical protein